MAEMGQCPVMAYHRELMLCILHSRISVAAALNVKVISLDEAEKAYDVFSKGEPVKYIFGQQHTLHTALLPLIAHNLVSHPRHCRPRLLSDPHNIIRGQGLDKVKSTQ